MRIEELILPSRFTHPKTRGANNSARDFKRGPTPVPVRICCFVFVLFGLPLASYFCQAQTPTPWPTCPPTPTASPSPCVIHVEIVGCDNCTSYDEGFDFTEPTPEPLANDYQPGDNTVLTRRVYVPDATHYPGPTYPTVVVAHAGGFKNGGTQDPGPEQVAEDFQRIGYLAISVTYRLAPCNVIQGQHCHDGTAEGITSGPA